MIAAQKRGVKVRVMLNPARRSGEDENEESRAELLKAQASRSTDSNPAFDLTHEKSMVVDDATAFVKSLNWDTENLTETRDYAVVTDDHAHEVAEIIECFEADWNRKTFDPGDGAASHLVQQQRARAHRALHRPGEAHAVRAERALPGHGHHRAPGPRAASAASRSTSWRVRRTRSRGTS